VEAARGARVGQTFGRWVGHFPGFDHITNFFQGLGDAAGELVARVRGGLAGSPGAGFMPPIIRILRRRCGSPGLCGE
jgi:hypothetical protein